MEKKIGTRVVREDDKFTGYESERYKFLLEATMNWREYIESNPSIMLDKPVIKDTRITVELLLEKIANGESFEQILEAHPRLTIEAIRAAIAFAAENLRADVIYPLSPKI